MTSSPNTPLEDGRCPTGRSAGAAHPSPEDGSRPEAAAANAYLLVKRGLYYRPNSCGYTGIKELAGRYLESDAIPQSGVIAVPEGAAPEYAPACFPDLATAHFARRVSSLSKALTDLVAGQVHIHAPEVES